MGSWDRVVTGVGSGEEGGQFARLAGGPRRSGETFAGREHLTTLPGFRLGRVYLMQGPCRKCREYRLFGTSDLLLIIFANVVFWGISPLSATFEKKPCGL
jgi:hypothetical protein